MANKEAESHNGLKRLAILGTMGAQVIGEVAIIPEATKAFSELSSPSYDIMQNGQLELGLFALITLVNFYVVLAESRALRRLRDNNQ